MNRNSALVIVALAIIALSLIGALIFLNSFSPYPASPVPITISIPPIDASALYYIAEDRHFFAENGLNVTVRYSTRSGRNSVRCCTGKWMLPVFPNTQSS